VAVTINSPDNGQPAGHLSISNPDQYVNRRLNSVLPH